MDPWMLHGKSPAGILQFFQINFLSITAIPLTIAIVVFFVIRPIVRNRFFTDSAGQDNRPDFRPFYWLILTCQVLSCFLSAVGFTPWYITKMWSLYLVALSMIAVLLLVSEIVWFFRRHEQRVSIHIMSYLRPMVLIALLVMVVVLSRHAASYRHVHRVDLGSAIDYLENLDLPDRSVFVAFYQVPIVRYLYEYGPYREGNCYPRVFWFETKAEWEESLAINAAGKGFLYFLTAQRPEEISQRLPHSKARLIEGVSKHLLKVVRDN